MSPKRKDAPSSSDTSTSNTSSTSTTSSSSSASESSSSESDENSSSSAVKSGNHSTDSEKRPARKKASLNTRSSKVENVETEKKDKLQKPKAPQVLYSSDSEGSTSKVNSKRKPQPKPKASATVTPVSKTAKPPPKNPVKKVNPPRRAAQKSLPKDSSKPTALPKLDDAKKLKTKSIFSPDNSSDSDDDTSTPPPPKLTAMKTAASKVNAAIKTKTKVKTRSSSVSSNSSESLESSRSSSVSSPSSRNTAKPITKKNGNVNAKKEKKTAPPLLTSDRDSDIAPTRKSTRSSSRKSKHVVARLQSDTDSDTGSKLSATSKSPTKKVAPKGPLGMRKPKSSNASETSLIVENEERTCPLEGCDSFGHLGGRLEKHFTLEACPTYHNTTAQLCKDAFAERVKREEERKKAANNLKTGQSAQPTPEQKEFRDKVKEVRSKFVPKEDSHSEPESSKERQPDLSKCSNKYDLKLFQEAQAVACEAIEEELKQLPNVRCIKHIEMGKFEMEVWYQSPYPDDYTRLPKLYLCEYCLRYMKYRSSLERHGAKCVWRHPPGEEVYRKDKISVWEVDGKRYKTYCQNLCLLAKFFLDHKTLYYDVEPFLFYVMTISDTEGCHTVGYFSKEKNSFLNYNVSCILTLPPYQRQGYGRLLIDFSYLLTRVEGKIGSPEKPLSDLGLISYRSYWKDVLLEHLCNLGGKQLSVKDISQDTAINSYDIVSTLQALGMMKYWKGKHIILKKQDVIDEYSERASRRGFTYKEVNPSCLRWTPFVPPDTPSGAS